MNVLVLHLDGKKPNLAAMRIVAWHRAQRDFVELRQVATAEDLQPRLDDHDWDRVYGSLIFERTKPLAELARKVYPHIELGGTGWDLENGVMVRSTPLPPEIEAMAPDYSDYARDGVLVDSVDYSIGFAQRGCRLECSFCVVPRKEGRPRAASTIEEIWRGPGHQPHVMLLDNDFFGNPEWPDVIATAKRLDLTLSIIQGINARLLSTKQAEAIASVRWYDDGFKRTRIYTAWDDAKDERAFFRGIDRLVSAGISPDSIMVYMLVGHAEGETHADRDYRRRKLRERGCRPYPMAFTRDGEFGHELTKFASWVVQRVDLHTSWEDYYGRAGGEVRKLGPRRVSLPLFVDEDR